MIALTDSDTVLAFHTRQLEQNTSGIGAPGPPELHEDGAAIYPELVRVTEVDRRPDIH